MTERRMVRLLDPQELAPKPAANGPLTDQEALQRDAGRYRWLREQLKPHPRKVRAQALFWFYSSRADFDHAIDQAMVEEAVSPPRQGDGQHG